MNAAEILARTLWAEDASGGAAGMEPIAGVILNRAAQPGWWGKDVIGVCLAHAQFTSWFWGTSLFRKMLTVEEDKSVDGVALSVAMAIARAALAGVKINRANGATHYHRMNITPDWAAGRTPCLATAHHLFYVIGLGNGQ